MLPDVQQRLSVRLAVNEQFRPDPLLPPWRAWLAEHELGQQSVALLVDGREQLLDCLIMYRFSQLSYL